MPLSQFISLPTPRATPTVKGRTTSSTRSKGNDARAGSTLLSAFLGAMIGCLATLAGLWVRSSLERRRERDDRLVDLYAEFVGFAAADCKRCRLQRAELDVRPEDSQTDRARWLSHWREVEGARHNAHERLLRLRFQLRQIEDSPRRRMLIDQVCNVQPHFFRGTGFAQDIEFMLKSAGRFEDEIEAFSCSIDSLADSVSADGLSGNHGAGSNRRR